LFPPVILAIGGLAPAVSRPGIAPDVALRRRSDFAAGELRLDWRVKKTTAELDPQAAARLRELIADISVAMITTVTPDGALRSRPMFTQEIREGELWFFMSDQSRSAHDLAEEHAVNVSYADPIRGRFVSVTGLADIVRDRDRMRDFWGPAVARFFPLGVDDPHLTLLRVRIDSAEFWDSPSSRMRPIDASAPKNKPVDDGHTQIDIHAARTSG
jgi:general stress protein 26